MCDTTVIFTDLDTLTLEEQEALNDGTENEEGIS